MNNSRLLISLFFACCLILNSFVSVFADSKIIKSSSIAMNGEPKYQDGFLHFEYILVGSKPDELEEIIAFVFAYLPIMLINLVLIL